MNVEFINPFLSVTVNVLTTMAMMESKPGRPELKKRRLARGDVTGVAEMKGEQVTGSIALSFKKAAILEITKQLLGEAESPDDIDETVMDVVGELTNMVMGGAKNKLSEQGYQFEMSVPKVFSGDPHEVVHTTTAPTIVIPFSIADSEYFVEVCFKSVK